MTRLKKLIFGLWSNYHDLLYLWSSKKLLGLYMMDCHEEIYTSSLVLQIGRFCSHVNNKKTLFITIYLCCLNFVSSRKSDLKSKYMLSDMLFVLKLWRQLDYFFHNCLIKLYGISRNRYFQMPKKLNILKTILLILKIVQFCGNKFGILNHLCWLLDILKRHKKGMHFTLD